MLSIPQYAAREQPHRTRWSACLSPSKKKEKFFLYCIGCLFIFFHKCKVFKQNRACMMSESPKCKYKQFFSGLNVVTSVNVAAFKVFHFVVQRYFSILYIIYLFNKRHGYTCRAGFYTKRFGTEMLFLTNRTNGSIQ